MGPDKWHPFKQIIHFGIHSERYRYPLREVWLYISTNREPWESARDDASIWSRRVTWPERRPPDSWRQGCGVSLTLPAEDYWRLELTMRSLMCMMTSTSLADHCIQQVSVRLQFSKKNQTKNSLLTQSRKHQKTRKTISQLAISLNIFSLSLSQNWAIWQAWMISRA